MVVVVEKLFLQQRFYFCKVVVASMFLLCVAIVGLLLLLHLEDYQQCDLKKKS